MPTDDLLTHAQSTIDYYALLGEGVHTGSTLSELSRAYRRSSLKHHPDKNRSDPNAVERFHQLQIAYDVLSDSVAKSTYDAAREARERKKARTQEMDEKRRKMVEELERSERASGFKRRRNTAEDDEESKKEREYQRLAEDGKRRRLEMQEKLREKARLEKEREMERYKREQEPEDSEDKGSKEDVPTDKKSELSEMERGIRLKWNMDGPGKDITRETLTTQFEKYGKIDMLIVKEGKKKKSKHICTGLVVFQSMIGVYGAMQSAEKDKESEEWKVFDKVERAETKE
jgi:DnaJ family protein C protein 17